MRVRRALKWVGVVFGIVGVAGVVSFFTWLPAAVDAHYNAVVGPAEASVAPFARKLHRAMFVADLHCDALLWGRDLAKRSTRGQVDVPRLLEGNVSLETFSAVTKAPAGPAFDPNGFDRVTPLILAQRWPMRTWGSLAERTLFQAQRFHDLVARSEGKLVAIASADDLSRLLDQRAMTGGVVGGLLAIEGLHALEGRFENVDRFADAGFRMMGLAHFFDDEVGGSCHSAANQGLTELGRRVVRRMEERGVLVDLAHASPRTIDDVLEIATRPVVVSHTGVRATCDTERNLSDDQLRRIAANGGVIGIAFFEGAAGSVEPAAIARAIRHAVEVAGVEHVAIGSDFDGSVATSFDAAHLERVTDALLASGMDMDDVRRVMGVNVERLLEKSLLPR